MDELKARKAKAVTSLAKALARAHDRLVYKGEPTALLAYNAGSVAVYYWDTLAKIALRNARAIITSSAR